MNAAGDEPAAAETEAATPVAVVFERGRAGEAALRAAVELAGARRELWVLSLVPLARSPLWGRASGTGPYNEAVQQEAESELDEARAILGPLAESARFEVLRGSPQPPLAKWANDRAIGLVVLPHHRFTPGGNIHARSLRAKTSAELRLIRP